LQKPGLICKTLIRWKDRHAKLESFRDSLMKMSQPRRGSQIQRPRMHARVVNRAVHPAHGSTMDRTEGVSPGFDQRRGSAIQRPRTRASGSGGGVRRRAAARGGGSPASPLDSAPSHHFVHELVHFVAEVRAHVEGGVLGVDRASSAAGTERGRRGRSGELVSAPKCSRRREIECGILLTVRRRGRRARR
jgi:hypothetical protein